MPPAYAQDFQQVLANAKLQIVEHAGHLLQVERPSAVADLVETFLARQAIPVQSEQRRLASVAVLARQSCASTQTSGIGRQGAETARPRQGC